MWCEAVYHRYRRTNATEECLRVLQLVEIHLQERPMTIIFALRRIYTDFRETWDMFYSKVNSLLRRRLHNINSGLSHFLFHIRQKTGEKPSSASEVLWYTEAYSEKHGCNHIPVWFGPRDYFLASWGRINIGFMRLARMTHLILIGMTPMRQTCSGQLVYWKYAPIACL